MFWHNQPLTYLLKDTKQMASNIVRYDGNDGIEILIDSQTGESFCSIRGYARMAGKNESTIQRRLSGVASGANKTAEVVTGGGLQGVALITEDLIVEWLPKDNPKAATSLLKLGVRMGLHKLAGFELSSTAMQPKHQEPTLPPADIRVSNFHAALTSFGIEIDNPRYQQAFKDLVIDITIGANTRIISPTTEHWRGVAEIAESMGYSPTLVSRFRSSLGRYVGANKEHLTLRTEERLCNGTMRPINLYLDDDQVRNVISEYMDAKVLAS
jgi:hypothetical protein